MENSKIDSKGFTHSLALYWAACASILELGPILWILSNSGSLIAVLILGLVYQLGNGLERWIRRPKAVAICLALFGVICYAFSPSTLFLAALGTWSLSLALQVCRRSLAIGDDAPHVKTSIKRTARVAGFALAALFPLIVLISIVGLSILMYAMFATSRNLRQVTAPHSIGHLHRLHAIMVTHQTHYFIYAYPIVFMLYVASRSSSTVTAILFAAGWVSYLCAEHLWRRYPLKAVFIMGHLAVAAFLSAIALGGWPISILSILWILTGLGGGSVYCLTRMSNMAGLSEDATGFWEDVGHVLGIAVSLGLAWLFKFSASDLAFVAAAFALLTAMLMHFFQPKRSVAKPPNPLEGQAN